jgi:hypothetical protein
VTVHQPDCSTIPAMFQTQVENLIVKLFHCSVFDMNPHGKLWPLAKCLLATFLMHMSDMRVRYPHHKKLKAVAEKCNECGLHVTLLLEWGNEIRQKFMTDNVKAIIDDGGSLIPIMLEKMIIMQKNEKIQQEVSYNRFDYLFLQLHLFFYKCYLISCRYILN